MNIEIDNKVYNILKKVNDIEGYDNYSDLIYFLLSENERLQNIERIGYV